ncbi:MAG TPA: hypothetical protein PJ994_04135, partial [Tepidiformaceae bacterium]|nr:hypothetical protein [Tepidiformaceae bacterium]
TSTSGPDSSPTGAAPTNTTAPGEPTNTPPPAGETPVVLEPTFTCDSPVGILEIRTLDGEEVEFSERVAEIGEREGNTILAVGGPFSAVLRVEVIIWPAAVAEFDVPIAQAFNNRVICARGTVDNIGGVRTIQVQSADQLTVVAE